MYVIKYNTNIKLLITIMMITVLYIELIDIIRVIINNSSVIMTKRVYLYINTNKYLLFI